MPTQGIIALWALYSFTRPLKLTCNFNFTEVHFKFEVYVIHYLNLCRFCLFEFVWVEEGHEVHETFKVINVWEPLLYEFVCIHTV